MVEFFSELAQKVHIDLMVQETVDLQDFACADFAVFQDPIFQKFHI